jgi:hypothetical protein
LTLGNFPQLVFKLGDSAADLFKLFVLLLDYLLLGLQPPRESLHLFAQNLLLFLVAIYLPLEFVDFKGVGFVIGFCIDLVLGSIGELGCPGEGGEGGREVVVDVVLGEGSIGPEGVFLLVCLDDY